ncbi:hypothetical protein [Mycobacterium phage Weirdo19]|uniref:Uncharacterized protein n=1 Tax=Mycobacterium phage Weirdo19 TaxID=2601610 RepID=A0A6M2YSN9_9CAUD|nr:hypothetical protein KDJ11_gp30 [Mycobacterium phage Weirdo19]QEA10798.1 hypothetical protein [Mycobacterium phage Weirdo19]
MTDLFSVRFGIGVLVGIALQRVWAYAEARYQDRRAPLPGGPRRIGGLNRVWVVGAVAFAVFAYSVVETQRLADCQAEFGKVLAQRSAITTENDRLSREQRDLLADFAEQEALWLADLLNPPGELADLDNSHPAYRSYERARTRQFIETTASVRERIEAISAEQAANVEERASNPIPDPTCGRGR